MDEKYKYIFDNIFSNTYVYMENIPTAKRWFIATVALFWTLRSDFAKMDVDKRATIIKEFGDGLVYISQNNDNGSKSIGMISKSKQIILSYPGEIPDNIDDFINKPDFLVNNLPLSFIPDPVYVPINDIMNNIIKKIVLAYDEFIHSENSLIPKECIAIIKRYIKKFASDRMEHLSEEDTTFEKVFEKDRWELMRHLYYDGYILPLFMDYDTCLKYTKMKYNEELYHIMLKEGEKLSDGY